MGEERKQDRRKNGSNRRTSDTFMGRRWGDLEWLRKHYIDPVIKEALAESERRFEGKVNVSVNRAVKEITSVIKNEDRKRDWRSLRIAGLTSLLVVGIAFALAKLCGWI